jgi:hypothetical protein
VPRVAALRAEGHDVVWVRVVSPGMRDPDVLAWAIREGRVLLTFDKDFGELAKASALPACLSARRLGRPLLCDRAGARPHTSIVVSVTALLARNRDAVREFGSSATASSK